ADHAVIAAVGGDIGLQRAAAGLAVTDVEAQDAGLAAKGADIGGGGLGGAAAAAAMHRDGKAVLRQAQGDGTADAATGTGDQDGAGCHQRRLICASGFCDRNTVSRALAAYGMPSVAWPSRRQSKAPGPAS